VFLGVNRKTSGFSRELWFLEVRLLNGGSVYLWSSGVAVALRDERFVDVLCRIVKCLFLCLIASLVLAVSYWPAGWMSSVCLLGC